MDANTFHISELLPTVLTDLAACSGRPACIETLTPVAARLEQPHRNSSLRDNRITPTGMVELRRFRDIVGVCLPE